MRPRPRLSSASVDRWKSALDDMPEAGPVSGHGAAYDD